MQSPPHSIWPSWCAIPPAGPHGPVGKRGWTLPLALILWTLGTLISLRSALAAPRVDGCQCTDFVYSQRPDIPRGMGDAKDWLYSARLHRLPFDQIPQVGDVAVILNGAFGFSAQYGHVALVIRANADRTHFTNAGWNGLRGDCRQAIYRNAPVHQGHRFHPPQRPVPAADRLWPLWKWQRFESMVQ